MTAQPMLSNLTIGLDLSDTHAHYCVVNAHGQVLQTGRACTTSTALERAFTAWPGSRVVLEVGTHSPWVSRLLTRLGYEVLVANARQLRLIYASHRKSDRVDAEALARLGRLDPTLLHPIQRGRLPASSAPAFVAKARAQLPPEVTAALAPLLTLLEDITRQIRAMEHALDEVARRRAAAATAHH